MTDETQASLTTLGPLLRSIASHFDVRPVLAAEYTNGSKARSPVLTINRIAGGRREFVSEHKVAGKREARALAKSLNAICWNF